MYSVPLALAKFFRRFVVYFFEESESFRKALHSLCKPYIASIARLDGTLPNSTRNQVFCGIGHMSLLEEDGVG